MRRPQRVRLIFWTRIPSRVARFLREVEWRTWSNFGCSKSGIDAGELEDPAQRRGPVGRAGRCLEDEDLLAVVVVEEALQLHEVPAAGHVGGVRVQQRLAQVALLAPLRVVVDVVGGDPLERIADDVDQLRVGDDRRPSARARPCAAG